ncbi:kxdl motif-containing protein 1-like [Plakobranchus ocellatus]|uniref:Kxdl motif-containing protein 1-like n=1 Tax=Plakobranchus ocellatus TaxID=259542 RepID=A0AAV4CK28_9GAST|nr:kxdl motif-containing protein 1-like [Plakobranchus ocellatus]
MLFDAKDLDSCVAKLSFNMTNQPPTRQKAQRNGLNVTGGTLFPIQPTDLAPSDFYLFGPLKRHLRGKKFDDEDELIDEVRGWLGRFEKTNEMLINFNMLSAGRYEATVKEFQKHTQLLFEMKKDLNGIFRRIRMIKNRLEKAYPDAFAVCSHTYNVASEDEEEEEEEGENNEESQQHRKMPRGFQPDLPDAQDEITHNGAERHQPGPHKTDIPKKEFPSSYNPAVGKVKTSTPVTSDNVQEEKSAESSMSQKS